MRVLISQGGLSPPPPLTLCHRCSPCSVLVLVSAYTVFAAGVGPPTTSHTTKASYAGLIRLIPMPVMIARHIFLMTSGYQRVLKHATSKARSRSPSVSSSVKGARAYCQSVSTPPLCALRVPAGQAGTCVQLGLRLVATKTKGKKKSK